MKNKLTKLAIALLGSSIAIGANAIASDTTNSEDSSLQVQHPNPTFKLIYNKNSGQLRIKAQAKCIPQGATNTEQSISARFDKETKTVLVSGGFSYHMDGSQTDLDCEVTLRHDIVLEDIEPGRHKLKYIGKMTDPSNHNSQTGKQIGINNKSTNTKSFAASGKYGLFRTRIETGIRFVWSPDTQQANLHLRSACLRADNRGVSSKFDAQFDAKTNTINLTGDYRIRRFVTRKNNTDCTGTRADIIKLPDLSPGEYTLIWKHRKIWKGTLGDEAVDYESPLLDLYTYQDRLK